MSSTFSPYVFFINPNVPTKVPTQDVSPITVTKVNVPRIGGSIGNITQLGRLNLRRSRNLDPRDI